MQFPECVQPTQMSRKLATKKQYRSQAPRPETIPALRPELSRLFYPHIGRSPISMVFELEGLIKNLVIHVSLAQLPPLFIDVFQFGLLIKHVVGLVL